MFGLIITHNKSQEFNLILQIRKRGWGEWSRGRERQGISSSNSGTSIWQENVSSSCLAKAHFSKHHTLMPCPQSSEFRLEQTTLSTDSEGSGGKRSAALPTNLHKSTPDPTGAAGTQGCLLSRALGPLRTAGSGRHHYRRDTGRNSGRQELSWRENPSTVIPPASLL